MIIAVENISGQCRNCLGHKALSFKNKIKNKRSENHIHRIRWRKLGISKGIVCVIGGLVILKNLALIIIVL